MSDTKTDALEGRNRSFRLAGVLGRLNVDRTVVGIPVFDWIYRSIVALLFFYLLFPVLFAIITSVNPSELYILPPDHLTLQWYVDVLTDPAWIASFITSFQYSILATLIAIVLSTSAAYAIVKFDFRGKNALNAITLLPLIVPQITLGLALLIFLNRFGLVGSLTGLSFALAVYATPYATQSILAAMNNFDMVLEEAAQDLGADEIQTFVRVTLPLLFPGVLTAAIFSFIVSYGNLQLAVFLQGPGTVPIPVRIFSEMEFGSSPTIAAVATINIILVMIAIALAEYLFDTAEALGYL